MVGKHGFVYVLLAMVVPEGAVHMTGEVIDIMHRAFTGLVDGSMYLWGAFKYVPGKAQYIVHHFI